jgi:hypothetical protein
MLSLISKAICGWAKLLYVHESLIVARIIVKVLVNNEQDIPDDFVVTVGEAPRVRSFNVPVYILTPTDVVDGGDEQLTPENSPAHPLPHPAPRWMTMQEQAISANSDVVVGDAPHADQMDVAGQLVAGHMDENDEPGQHEQQAIADQDQKLQEPVVEAGPNEEVQSDSDASLKSRTDLSPAAQDFEASRGFDRGVPTTGTRTSSVPIRELFQKALVDPAEMRNEQPSNDDSVKIISDMPQVSSSKKHLGRKPKGPIDSKFLRRSGRLKLAIQGFKNASSATAAEVDVPIPTSIALPADPSFEAPLHVSAYQGAAADGSAAAPLLPTPVVQGIGTEFLKMHPQDVSDALLLASNVISACNKSLQFY